MDPYQPDTHSFIVKVWLEETGAEKSTANATGAARQPRWRGHITHVVSGERRYLQSLAEVKAFIEGYLMRMGVPPEGDAPPVHRTSGKDKRK